MVKITILFGRPADEEAFARAYEEHLELARGLPHATRLETSRLLGGGTNQPLVERGAGGEVIVKPLGSVGFAEPMHYQMTEIWFESEADRLKAMHTGEGARFEQQAMRLATGGADIMLLETEAVPLAR
jgi:hypothetical protein